MKNNYRTKREPGMLTSVTWRGKGQIESGCPASAVTKRWIQKRIHTFILIDLIQLAFLHNSKTNIIQNMTEKLHFDFFPLFKQLLAQFILLFLRNYFPRPLLICNCFWNDLTYLRASWILVVLPWKWPSVRGRTKSRIIKNRSHRLRGGKTKRVLAHKIRSLFWSKHSRILCKTTLQL